MAFDPRLKESSELPGKSAGDPVVVLSTHGLTKDFKKLRAVDQLDLTVYRGDVFGFLGPNGAGKTTTIRLIFGLTYPTGRPRRDPRPPRATRPAGGAPSRRRLRRRPHLLRQHDRPPQPAPAGRYERRSDRGAHHGGAWRWWGSQTGASPRWAGYSHGMRQRLGIALALIHSPDLIILDEPTSGLDPQGMKDVRELIRELGPAGHHGLPLVAPAARDRTRLQPGRHPAQGPPDRPGTGGESSSREQLGQGPHGRPGTRAGGAARTSGSRRCRRRMTAI